MAGPRDILTSSRRTVEAISPTRRRTLRALRWVLVVVILSVTSSIFLWPDMNKIPAPQKVETTAAPSNELVNPEFSSVDGQAQPYTVTAARAVQHKDAPDLVDLTDPSGHMTLKAGEKVAVQAKGGLLDQEKKSLVLTGGVTLSQNQDLTLSADSVSVDMKAKTLSASVPVSASFPQGSLEAAGMEGAYDNGTMVFKGPAKLILNNTTIQGKMMP